MEIYVKSRGVSKDYCWLDQTKKEISDPPYLKPAMKMVNSDYFSLVFYRPKDQNNKLFLLITGFKSQKRIDQHSRNIRNSLLWVGKDSDEATLRKLAIQALNGELEAKVDSAVISENNDQGFTVNFDRLKPENLGLASVENNPADSAKIGNLSALKNDLIGDLKKYALPKHDGMLVVVCETVSKSSLEGEQVWRGLSDQISDDDWTELPMKGDKGDNFRSSSPSGKSVAKNVGKSVSDSQQSSSRYQIKSQSTIGLQNDNKISGTFNKWLSLILAFIFGLVIGIIANQLWYQFTENQLKQNIKSLRSEITELKQEKDDLANDIEIKKQEIKAYETFESEVEKSKKDLEKKLTALKQGKPTLEAKSS